MGERTLGFNRGDDTPSGDGQPDEKTPVSGNIDELGQELDATLKHEDVEVKDGEFGDDEETVVLSKAQLEKLKSDRDHYKNGLLSTKDKLKGLKANKVVEKKPPVKDENENTPFMTKKDVIAQEEKKAIKNISSDPYNDKNYKDILQFYRSPQSDLPTAAEMEEAWEDARTLFIKKNPDKAPTDEDKAGLLAADRGRNSGGGTHSEGKPSEKKSILAKKTPMKEWY